MYIGKTFALCVCVWDQVPRDKWSQAGAVCVCVWSEQVAARRCGYRGKGIRATQVYARRNSLIEDTDARECLVC